VILSSKVLLMPPREVRNDQITITHRMRAC